MVFSSMLGGMAGGAAVSIVIRGVDQFSKTFTKAQVSMAGISKAMLGLGATAGIAFAAIGVSAIKTSIAYESAFAGVRKTVDLTEEQFGELENRFKSLSEEIPVSFIELSKIGEIAGQLGVDGVDNIEKFTKVIAGIAATTNLTQEAAATDFARIANVMKEPIENVDRMAATIVDLGNNFATTESEISDFAQRIAGAGALAGFATSDIMSLGAAFTSVGVRAEAGGTAVQKVLTTMIESVAEGGDKLDEFAKTAGMTSSQFAKLFKDDAAKAFEVFVLGLGKQGDQAFKTLENLQLQDQRLVRSFLSLANAGDLVTRTLNTGTTAWDDNTAAIDEQEKRYATLESQLITTKNMLTNISDEIGDEITPAFADLNDAIKNNKDGIITWGTGMGETMAWVAEHSVKILGDLANEFDNMGYAISALFDDDKTLADVVTYSTAIGSLNKEVVWGDKALVKWIKDYPELAKVLRNTHPAIDEQLTLTENLAEAQKRYTAQVESGLMTEKMFFELFPEYKPILEDHEKFMTLLNDKYVSYSKANIVATETTKDFTDAVNDLNDSLTKTKLMKSDVRGYNRLSAEMQAVGGGSAFEGGSAIFSGDAGYATSVNDFILSKTGQLIKTNPNDTLIGTKTPGSLGGTTIIISDNNIYGTDPDDIATALQRKLSNMITT